MRILVQNVKAALMLMHTGRFSAVARSNRSQLVFTGQYRQVKLYIPEFHAREKKITACPSLARIARESTIDLYGCDFCNDTADVLQCCRWILLKLL
ncbi:hypothetical protein GDO78_020614 [Eleutherodactylus coqui]|uniref:Uncharacterized protein n=1 Tax=Eleutherodactylus coqui TaxID=57060 RepID=A0A8J6BBP0_ELECQ|nr:hypothetical protein GDO78_020614 [Eleutherodactylus coqui]